MFVKMIFITVNLSEDPRHPLKYLLICLVSLRGIFRGVWQMTMLSLDSTVRATHAYTGTKLWKRHNIGNLKRNETAPQPVPTSYTHLKINWLANTMKRDTKNQTRLLPAGGENIFAHSISDYLAIFGMILLNGTEKILGQQFDFQERLSSSSPNAQNILFDLNC